MVDRSRVNLTRIAEHGRCYGQVNAKLAGSMVIDAGDRSKWRSRPETVYLATERLKELFAGVGKVFLVDDTYECLRG
jgi:hypothetical protein